MASYPRVECPECRGVYGGAPTRAIGMVSVVDHKREPRSLQLCPGSMVHVRLRDAGAWQEELPDEEPAPAPPGLFDLP
ncbi:hypothetical protein [Streptomyces sp. NPDC089919]|uniref:hypothetical protein n=1 Tax=Streptomyces sp. NPDC089919 TaxID=3155188 RepID=UPI0034342E66